MDILKFLLKKLPPNNFHNLKKVNRLSLFKFFSNQKYHTHLMNKNFEKKHSIYHQLFILKLGKIRNLHLPFLKRQLFWMIFSQSNCLQYDILFSFFSSSIQAIHNHHLIKIQISFVFHRGLMFILQHILTPYILINYFLQKLVYDFRVYYH